MSNDMTHLTTADTNVATRCPAWCTRNHEQALEEGNSPAESEVHMGPGFGGFLDDLHNPVRHAASADSLNRKGGGMWEMVLEQANPRVAVVSLDCRVFEFGVEGVSRDEQVSLHLTTGEARVLAAQLVRLADLGDLS